eukprot:gene4731-21030_t
MVNLSILDVRGTELPPEPEKPFPNDCCGSGCSPCVFDIYERDMELWRKECLLTKHNNNNKSSSESEHNASLSLSKYTSLELQSVTELNTDTSSYRFKLPEGTSLKLEVGQHLLLRSKKEDKIVTRSYTPITCNQGHFDVIIKRYQNGKMSQCISQWSVGDMVEWRGPFGKLKYKPNEYDEVIMLAAGTGIAPMLQLIRAVLGNDNDDTRLTLLYSCKKACDILMKDQLDEFRAFWNFNVTYFLTQASLEDDQSCIRYGDVILNTRIDKDFLLNILPKASDRTKILICGTKSFDKDMINYALNIGYQLDEIFIF